MKVAIGLFFMNLVPSTLAFGCADAQKFYPNHECFGKTPTTSFSDDSERFLLHKGELAFHLILKKVSSPEEDIDLTVRKLMLSKAPGCSQQLVEERFEEGVSIQLLRGDPRPISRFIGMSPREDEMFLRVFAGTAHCLKELHILDFIHTNISGDTVLVTPEGTALLSGFSSVVKKNFLAKGRGNFLKQPLEVLENWNNQGIIWTTAQDAWSFGILVYETIFGVLPYSSTNRIDLIEEMKNTPTFTLPPPVEISFIDILNKCLKIEPNNRSAASELDSILNLAHRFFGKYIERYVNLSLYKFSVVEKASVLEMFSEMIFISVMCFIIIPVSVYLISAKVRSDEAAMMNRVRAVQQAPQNADRVNRNQQPPIDFNQPFVI